MALAISLILAAGGAILVWGIDADVAGVDLNVIGWVGIVVGIAGAVLALAASARREPAGRGRRRESVVER